MLSAMRHFITLHYITLHLWLCKPCGLFLNLCPSFCKFIFYQEVLVWNFEFVMTPHIFPTWVKHYSHIIMGTMVSQIASLTILYSTAYSSVDQRKNQSSASLAFVWGIHRWLVNSAHKWPVTGNMFPFDDVIMVFWCLPPVILIHITVISIVPSEITVSLTVCSTSCSS